MKKILSKTLLFGLTTNMFANSYAMEAPGWVNGTNCTKPNTCLVTQDPTSGLFELVLNNLTTQQPSPIYNLTPLAYTQPTPQTAAANEWTASTYIALGSAITGISALVYAILSKCCESPLTKFKNKIKNRINNLTTTINDPATGLKVEVASLKMQSANHDTQLQTLSNLGATSDSSGKALSLNDRLELLEKEYKKYSILMDGDSKNKIGLEKVIFGDHESNDPFLKEGLLNAFKKDNKKLSNFVTEKDLKLYTAKAIQEKLSYLVTKEELKKLVEKEAADVAKEEISKLLKEKDEKIKNLEAENHALKATQSTALKTVQMTNESTNKG